MTRPDQTRPDQTRPDQTSILRSIKTFIKKHDRFLIAERTRTNINNWRYGRDILKRNLSKNKEFEKMPYIIRRAAPKVGLFSYFITILGGIAYADKKGLIPVVDMRHDKNSYLYDNETGRINAWEYYFAQPGGLSLDNALSSKKYILCRDTALHQWPGISAATLYNRAGVLNYWRRICKKYIHFTEPVLERLNAMKERTKGKKILGVLVRGTDYTALKPHGHPIPPTAEQAIAKVKEVMQEKIFDVLYLATEDKKILAKFQNAFGKKLLSPECEYVNFDYDDNNKFLSEYDINRKNDKYLRGLEYLVSMLFLSSCSGFITSVTSGSAGVMLLSEGFEYLYVFDLGIYP